MPINAETLRKLAEFDSPTISNVIELFDVVPRNAGYMSGQVQCNFPELPPMVGFASTAAFRSAAPPVGGGAAGARASPDLAPPPLISSLVRAVFGGDQAAASAAGGPMAGRHVARAAAHGGAGFRPPA